MATRYARGRSTALALTGLALAGGCAGDGCGGCVGTTPGGFPPESRMATPGQVRLTQTAIAKVESNPAALAAYILGAAPGEDLDIDVPPVCKPAGDPYVCCTEEGAAPLGTCGPIRIDLDPQGGDAARLEINPINGGHHIDVIVRARVKSLSDLMVEYADVNCLIGVQTDAKGSQDHAQLTVGLDVIADGTSDTARIDVTGVALSGVETADLDLKDPPDTFYGCDFIDWDFPKAYIIGKIESTVEGIVSDALAEQFCDKCPGGSVDECSGFADACDDGVCMRGGACDQELGLSGRIGAAALLGGFSSGQLGALDVYQVAGGYAETEANGVSLGVLGGLLPAAAPRDRCGPAAAQPEIVPVSPSPVFRGNTRPDTDPAQPFDFALGLHQRELDMLSWAAYESGFLCANVGSSAVPLLNSGALSPFIRSIDRYTHGRVSPVFVGLRPQSPPLLQIGPNTFIDDPQSGERVIDQPLIDVTMPGVEVDLYLMVDDQYVRLMTIVADLHLPVGVEVDENGDLIPVLSDLEGALGNVSILNSDPLLETPEELADIVPSLISVALPALGDALPPIAVPDIGPLSIDVKPDGITSVEDNAFVAVFGDVTIITPSASTVAWSADRATTSARIAAVRGGERPVVELELGGQAPGGRAAALEWSYRVDGSMWSPYTRSSRVALARASLRLAGEHQIEVRAREIDRPRTTDRSPLVLSQRLGPDGALVDPGKGGGPGVTDPVLQFHGKGQGGCECGTSGGAGGTFAGLLVALAVITGSRRRRLNRRQATGDVWLSVVFVLVCGMLGGPGCSCSDSVKCAGPDGECLDGEPQRGPTGRWSSTAISAERLVVSAYDQLNGDLVFIEVNEEGESSFTAVDGVPFENLPTYHPDGYREGIAEPGEDVGAYTSIALRDGRALIAYQDLSNRRLRVARETDDGWEVSEVDGDDSGAGSVGAYASLAIGPDGIPSIAYLATGLDDQNGGFLSQLRYARAATGDPSGPDDWSVEVLDEVPVGAPDPEVYDLPLGTGLFASHVLLTDGRSVVVYYDRENRALEVASQQGGWEVATLDAGDGLDRGMWVDAMVDESGTVQIAYQDSIGDQLLHTTWRDGTAGAIEVVDDGVRAGDSRTHPVGASASLFIDQGGDVAIAYQDGASSDLVIARRTSGSWTRDDLLTGPVMDAFCVSAASKEGRSAIATYQYDQALDPPGELEILVNP